MLKFFRDKKDSWFVKGILILTALSFMSLFGIQGMTELLEKNKPVITLKGKEITTQDFLNAFEQEINTLRALTDGRFSKSDALNAGMVSSTLNKIASKAVSQGAIDQLGLTVSNDSVRETVKSMPVFIGYDGQFSRSVFNDYLKRMSKSEAQFVDDLFFEMKAAQLMNASRTATVVPKKMAEIAYEIQGEKRDIDLFKISPKDIKISQKPSNAELEKLYKEMSDNLVDPEYRTITVMLLTLDTVADKVKVSEDEIRENYDENKARYVIEESRNVDQIMFETQDEAQKAFDDIRNGQDFLKVAKARAHQTVDQTNLGNVTPSTVTSELTGALFSAKKGQIIAPIQTAFGWQIFRINSVTPKKEISFAEVKKDIEKQIKESLAFNQMIALSTVLDDRLGAGEKIEDLAKSEKLTIKTYTFVDPTGLNQQGKMTDISKTPLSLAFLTDKNRETPMIEDGNSFFVLRVDEIKEPSVKSIERAKPELLKAFVEQKQNAEAQKIKDQIEVELKKGSKNKDIAKIPAVSFDALSDVTRKDAVIPAPALHALFAKKSGDIVTSASNDGYLVARITKVKPADAVKDPLGVAQVRRQIAEDIAQEKANNVLINYSAVLNVQIDENAVAQAFSFLSKSEATQEE